MHVSLEKEPGTLNSHLKRTRTCGEDVSKAAKGHGEQGNEKW